MYLKELTLRGFKSFASTTRFSFEPGITAIVGPNGSGKSNVVDALAWVMGEQGAKSLRGGNMADVIFAGGTSRGALGRAQVELTIDNSDGRLPISYSEVTISRTMFRSGGSEYAINRQPVRLLDVQELLSDSGLGRQMHVIVGQGQLDKVLSASPADRRAFIDEAAGVAKHRRRKERALRKLESMDANLVRVLDLTDDMAVRLKPLARQAKAARAAHGVRSTLAYASARVLADDLSRASAKVEKERVALEKLRAAATHTGQQISQLKEESLRLTEEQTSARILADQVGERYRDFTEQRGRFVSIEELANERAAGAARMPVAISESSVDLAWERAKEARAEAAKAQATAEKLQETYLECASARAQAEPALKSAQKDLMERQGQIQRETQHYERTVRELEAGRLALEAALGQAESARERLSAANARQNLADADVQAHLKTQGITSSDTSQTPESVAYEGAAEAERAARDEHTETQRRERTCIEEHSRLRSRRETLEISLKSQTTVDEEVAPGSLTNLVGKTSTLEENLHITRGWEEAITALLGPMLSALVIEGPHDYRVASDALAPSTTAAGLGAGGLLEAVAHGGDSPDLPAHPPLPEGSSLLPAVSVVTAPQGLQPALRSLLEGAFVCEDVGQAHSALMGGDFGDGRANTLIATRAGAVIGAGFTRLRGVPESSRLVLRANLEETVEQEKQAKEALEEASALVEKCARTLKVASTARQEALGRLRSADALRAKVAQETARLKALSHAATVDVERVERQVEQAQQKVAEHQQRVSALEAVVPKTRPAPTAEAIAEYEAAVESAREVVQKTWEAENQARMDAHIAKEAATAAQRNAHAFETQAQHLREDRAKQVEKETRARSAMSGFQTVAARAREGIDRSEKAGQDALELRDAYRANLQAVTEALGRAAQELRDLEEVRSGSSEELLQTEVAFASAAGTVGALKDRALELTAEYGSLLGLRLPTPPGLKRYDREEESPGEQGGVQPELWDEAQEAADNLLGAYGPHLPWEPPTENEEVDLTAEPYVREVAQALVEASSRQLSRLGVVNPLAIEEYEAASARYNFLQEQIQDLNRSKADLLDLIKQVDEQVKHAFEDAFADTAQKFESTFSRLFPGGTGRLELDDPSNPLTTGVEIYARPSGKRVTRLSLLSGGERSLAALAYLIAIFEARPSPFYILDEIEAALDDINLSRVLSLLEDLRKESQLLIITHQKRTMEFADALYGVTMKDGVTAVMSHRMAG